MKTIETDDKFYTIKGHKFVRVTTLLRERGLVDFSKIPERDRQFYMDRGTANHRLWQDVEKGVDGQFDYDPRVEEYRAAHANFLKDTGFKAMVGGIEQLVWNKLFDFAGRLDRLGKIQNRIVLIDYKTTSVHPSTAIQTALYLLCLPSFKFHEVERYGVAFKKGGMYQMSPKYPFSNRDEAIWHVSEYHKSIKEKTNAD